MSTRRTGLSVSACVSSTSTNLTCRSGPTLNPDSTPPDTLSLLFTTDADSARKAPVITAPKLPLLRPCATREGVPSRFVKAAPERVASQGDITREIATLAAKYQRTGGAVGQEAQPRLDYPPYRSSVLRHPKHPLLSVDPEEVERWAPCFGQQDVDPVDADLTAGHPGEPIGERIIVAGRVLDESGRPVVGQLIEIWQANASGRYRHQLDQHPAPLDPNFTGAGRCLTGPDGTYRFLTVKPGPYPWRNHHNAWRPAHIHFSVFGTAFTQRLVTQMYFPGDPLFDLDPIFRSIMDPAARQRLIARYDHDLTESEYATGYRWDIVLSGRGRTWTEGQHD
jgi:protocatechuate 3,4-dioxygenase beta subunit